jgi:hypothetical protein
VTQYQKSLTSVQAIKKDAKVAAEFWRFGPKACRPYFNIRSEDD